MSITRTCKTCGNGFTVPPSRLKFSSCEYCSTACRAVAWTGEGNPHWKGGLTTCTCEMCGKEFQRKPSHISKNENQFCSSLCARISLDEVNRSRDRGRIEKICKVCGEPFSVKPSKAKTNRGVYCSKQCMGKDYKISQTGELNSHWKGGITAQGILLRSTYSYRKWRMAVLERDGRVCQLCGLPNKLLATHHIEPVTLRPDLLLEVSNGITLCRPCHWSTYGHEAEFVEQFTSYTMGFTYATRGKSTASSPV